MMNFILEDSDETLSTHSGLSLIGLLLSKTAVSPRLTSLKISEMKSFPDIIMVIQSYLISAFSVRVRTILTVSNHSEKIPSFIVR
ncbi:hypothetical protein HXA35_02300 [Bacillus sp. A301a_S52]|nr:hypothetical protein [Bacillus sp. A301a_S52]